MKTELVLVQNVYKAFSKGEISTVLAQLSPDIEWIEAEGGPYGGVYYGPEAVLQNVFMKLGGEWDGFQAMAEKFIAEGSNIVVLGAYNGTYKTTGKSFTAPFAHAWVIQDDQAVFFQQYTDTAIHRRPLQQ